MTTQTGIQCEVCGESIYSNSRHDFVQCGCGETFVDGGFDYLRCGGTPRLTESGNLVVVQRDVDRRVLPFYFREESAADVA